MAGGVALNSVANGRILRETPFEEIYIQPAAGDGGGAVGAALYGYHTVLGKPRGFVLGHAYLGRSTRARRDRGRSCDRTGFATSASTTRTSCSTASSDGLVEGKVVGWFQGRFEWGPRALGQPQHPGRSAARGDEGDRQHEDQVPRAVPPVRAVGARGGRGGVLRLPSGDGTTRRASCCTSWTCVREEGDLSPRSRTWTARALQTVSRNANPRYHRLIERFGEATGVPVDHEHVLQPEGRADREHARGGIQHVPRSGMDALVLDDYFIEKRELQ